MEQAVKDAGDAKTPLVFHKKNGTDWLVTLTQEDFFEMLIAVHDLKQHDQHRTLHSNPAPASDIAPQS